MASVVILPPVQLILIKQLKSMEFLEVRSLVFVE